MSNEADLQEILGGNSPTGDHSVNEDCPQSHVSEGHTAAPVSTPVKTSNARLDLRFFFILESQGNARVTEWAMQMGLLGSWCVCPKCGELMRAISCKTGRDGKEWICRKRMKRISGEGVHHVKKSIRAGSWFEGTRLRIIEVLLMTVMWVKGCTHKFITEDLHLAKQTVTDYMNMCREVCVEVLVRKSEALGGEGVIVEVGECVFEERKSLKGKRLEGNWVFVGVERGSNKCFFRVVDKRKAKNLLEVLKEFVRPGSIVLSDCWKTYNCFEHKGFLQWSVDCSVHLKEPSTTGTRAHNTSFDGTWGAIINSYRVLRKAKEHFDAYVAEYLWRKQHKAEGMQQMILSFFDAIKELHPVPNHFV